MCLLTVFVCRAIKMVESLCIESLVASYLDSVAPEVAKKFKVIVSHHCSFDRIPNHLLLRPRTPQAPRRWLSA